MASAIKPVEDRRLLGIALMVSALFCYTVIDSCAKLMVQAGIPAMEVVFVRYAGQFILVLVLFLPRERRALARTRNLKLEIGRGLFSGGAVAEHLLLAVLDLQQLRAELLPAAGLLPQFLRLDGRDLEFHGTGAVHFLAHDALDLAQHAIAQRQPVVQAGGDLADHAGAQHQLLADDFGVGRGFLEGEQMELTGAHEDLRGRRSGT